MGKRRAVISEPKIEKRRVTYFAGLYRRGKLRAVKIGLATEANGGVERRLKALRTGNLDEIRLLATVPGKSAERKFHRAFMGYRIGTSKELYKPAMPIIRTIESLKQVWSLVEEIEKAERKHKE